jgi:hypothetical protein
LNDAVGRLALMDCSARHLAPGACRDVADFDAFIHRHVVAAM